MRVLEVLAGADNSVTGRNAVDWAALRADGLGLRLNIVRVVPDPWVYRRPSGYRQAMAETKDLLEAEASRVTAGFPGLRIRTTQRTGETPVVLRMLSDMAETVVLGSDRTPDSHGERFGSVSFEVTVCSRCPVAVIPAINRTESAGILAGVDGSEDSMIALDFAGAEATRLGEGLTLLHVQTKPGRSAPALGIPQEGQETAHEGQPLLDAAARTLRDRHPELTVHEVLETDDPPQALIRAGALARLLVIGCRGGGSARKPVGVVAATVLQHLPCPTIVTRPAPGVGGGGPAVNIP